MNKQNPANISCFPRRLQYVFTKTNIYWGVCLVSLNLSQGEDLNSSLEIKILSSEFAFGLKKLFWLLLTATFSEFSDPSGEPRPSEHKG